MWLIHRSPSPGVEVLTSAPALEAFAERQHAARQTIDALGLTAGNAVIVGGAGFALHGLDTFVGSNPETFDVDACVTDATFTGLQDASGAYVRPDMPGVRATEVHVPRTNKTLPVTGLSTPFHESLAYDLGATNLAELEGRAMTLGHINTLTPTELTRSKLNRGSPKDLAGIIKAHLIAFETHPIAQNERWQWDVIGAVNSISRRVQHNRAMRRGLPSWLGPLVASNFNHAAFTSLNPSMNALKRVS